MAAGSRPGAAVLAAVSAGGAVGAAARYGVSEAIPGGAVPWATLVANLTGCLLMGVLLEALERRPAHPLLRPFLGTGVLGGYTTFSTYAVGVHALLEAGRTGLALGYLVGTALGAVVAVQVGAVLVRAASPAGRAGRATGGGR